MTALLRASAVALLLCWSVACDDGAPAPDDAGVDAGAEVPPVDGGGADDGGHDAGAADAGGSEDAGVDAGTPVETCDGADNDGDGLVDEGPAGELLTCGGCAGDLLETIALHEQFDDAALYAQAWTPQYVAPVLGNGRLTFGPHPDSSNWWDKYSWVSTNASFGDALVCARFRFQPAGTRQNTFELFLRSSGELLTRVGLSPRSNEINLATRTSASMNTWITLDTAPLTVTPGVDQVFEVVLHAKGDRFHAEVLNLISGQVAVVSGQSPEAAASGALGFIGWELDTPVELDDVIIGTPSARALAIMESPQ